MMLGPMKKRLITTGIIAFIIPTIIFVGIFVAYSNKKNEEIAELKVKAATVQRYVAKTDMPIGHIVTSEDIEVAEVKEISTPINAYEVPEGLVGQKLKVEVFAGTLMTDSMFYNMEENYEIDIRNREFNMISLPSDLVAGDYVDIRILFPTGEDYVVIRGKEVKKIGTTTESSSIFLDLTEEEMNRMSSAIIESYITPAINLYAIKYSDWYEQLYDEVTVDYTALTTEAIESLIEKSKTIEYKEVSGERTPMLNESGERVRDDSGEIVYEYGPSTFEEVEIVKTEEELTDEEILAEIKMLLAAKDEKLAQYMNLKKEEVEAIRTAIKTKDKILLNLYEQRNILVETVIDDTYPIKPEVALVIAKNPNILEDLKARYNVEELVNERINLEFFIPMDDLEKFEQIKTNVEQEIATQKSERSEYLQSLVQQELYGMSN